MDHRKSNLRIIRIINLNLKAVEQGMSKTILMRTRATGIMKRRDHQEDVLIVEEIII